MIVGWYTNTHNTNYRGGWLLPRVRGFWDNVRQFILRLRFFSFLFFLVEISHSLARISSQWLTELTRLWPSVPWRVACELVSWLVPTLCLDSGIVSQLRLRWVKGVCVFRCNLSPALLAEWPESFTCNCGNTGVERTPNKSAHKVDSGEEISPAAPMRSYKNYKESG